MVADRIDTPAELADSGDVLGDDSAFRALGRLRMPLLLGLALVCWSLQAASYVHRGPRWEWELTAFRPEMGRSIAQGYLLYDAVKAARLSEPQDIGLEDLLPSIRRHVAADGAMQAFLRECGVSYVSNVLQTRLSHAHLVVGGDSRV